MMRTKVLVFLQFFPTPRFKASTLNILEFHSNEEIWFRLKIEWELHFFDAKVTLLSKYKGNIEAKILKGRCEIGENPTKLYKRDPEQIEGSFSDPGHSGSPVVIQITKENSNDPEWFGKHLLVGLFKGDYEKGKKNRNFCKIFGYCHFLS